MTFFDAMSKLATSVAEKATSPDASLPDSTDALKALTPYFAILYKANKADTDDSGVPTFGDLKAEIEAVAEKQNEPTTVPGGGRRSRPVWSQAGRPAGTFLGGSGNVDAVTQSIISTRANSAG